MVEVSVVIPAHNEEGNIERLVHAIRKESKAWELIIVDDNSTDTTPEIADRLSKDKLTRTLHRKGANGLGNALIDGTRMAKGKIIVWTMGDRSDDPRDIGKLVGKIKDGYDLVQGSRFIKGGSLRDYPAVKLVANRLFNNFLRIAFLIKEKDITNAFKAFRKEVFDSVNPMCSDFDITVELPLKAYKKGYKITEVPVRWYGRDSGVSKLKLKKIAQKYIKTSFKIWCVIFI